MLHSVLIANEAVEEAGVTSHAWCSKLTMKRHMTQLVGNSCCTC